MRDSWRAPEEDSMCVCVSPSWRMSPVQTGRGGVASLFSCARARRVKSCRGSLSHTHTLRLWAPAHIHTMRLRRLGSRQGPRVFGSHTLNQHLVPAWGSDSVPVTVLRVAGRSTAPSASSSFCSPSSRPFLKHEDPWRYLNLSTTLVSPQ